MIQLFHGFRDAFTGCPSMFADRKFQFVDTLRWQVPVIDARYEIDNYDSEVAVYLVESDEAGRHIGSLRLLPTTGPHILADIFEDLVDGDLPRGAGVMEITRLCLPSHNCAAGRLATRNALVRAMVDHALAARVDCLTGVVTARFRPTVLEMGWRAAPLGMARAGLGAFVVSLDAGTPGLLAANGVGAPLAAVAA